MQPGVDYIGVTIAFYCVDGKGKFLFQKRSNKCRDEHGKWDCGGGRIEFGETVKEAVLRELSEEYGCTGEILEQLPAHESLREWEGKKLHWIALPFVVKVDPAQVKNNEPEKVDALEWFTFDALPSPLHPAVEVETKQYREHLARYA